MTWTKLDDGFWSNPKVIRAGNEAAGVYARCLSYCGRHDTEGAVPQDIAKFIGRRPAFKRLVDEGLLEQAEEGYLVPDYLEFNPTATEVEAKRRARAEAGRRGGLASGVTRSKR